MGRAGPGTSESEALYAKKPGYTLVAVDALDRLAEQRGDAQDGDRDSVCVDGRRVCRNQLVNHPGFQPIDRDFVEDAVAHRRPYAPCPVRSENIRRGTKRTGRFCNIINQQHITTGHVADEIDRLDIRGALALFRHKCEAGAQDIGIRRGHLHPTDIGRTHD